jgi:hypothetical protein
LLNPDVVFLITDDDKSNNKKFKLISTLRSDTVSTVLLVEWQLTTDYFDGDVLNGPVPRLFAPDPAIAKAAITNDPAKAFKDVQRLHARLFISEHVIADEAWEFVGNPRYRRHLD